MKIFLLKAILIIILISIPASGIASDSTGKINWSFDNETRLMDEFFSVVEDAPESQTYELKAIGIDRVRRCATPVIQEIRRHLNSFSEKNRKIIMEYLFEKQPERISKKSSASYSYKVQRSKSFKEASNYYDATENFVIRWGDKAYNPDTRKGIDPADDNSNGVPDVVEAWGGYLEESWNKEITEMKLRKPRGSNQYKMDIYIANTTNSKRLSLGKNSYAYTTVYSDRIPYIVVNNFLPPTSNEDPEGDEVGAIKVTAAHEFSHTIQYAYDMNEAFWWQEASATWMEDEVFDEVNDYYQYVKEETWGLRPEITLLKVNGRHEYGNAIWTKYLSEYYGGSEIFKTIWKLCETYSALDANKVFFQNNGTTLKEAFKDFSAKNVTMSLSYEEGGAYGAMSVVSEHSSYPVSESVSASFFFPHPPSFLGANYIKFSGGSGENLKISFKGRKTYSAVNVKWGAVIVKMDSSGSPEVEEIELNKNQNGSIQISGFGTTYQEVYLVVSVLTQGPNNFRYGVPYQYSAELE